jgi:hypothetical protein
MKTTKIDPLDPIYKEIAKKYQHSFPSLNKAWRKLVSIRKTIGSKDFYFMILALQNELKNKDKTPYTLRKNSSWDK